MNWRASLEQIRRRGGGNTYLTRDGLEVMITYKRATVVLLTPPHETPFADFIELERWLAKSEENAAVSPEQFENLVGWESFLSQPDVPDDVKTAARTVLIPEAVRVLPFLDNYVFLNSGGMVTLTGEPPPTPTESAKSFRRVMDRPPGMPLWFLAAFPDVANWASETMGQAQLWREPAAIALVERLNEMRINLGETELGDVNGQLGPKHAAVLVRWFRETTNRELECGRWRA
jgi:hypothetical protein